MLYLFDKVKRENFEDLFLKHWAGTQSFQSVFCSSEQTPSHWRVSSSTNFLIRKKMFVTIPYQKFKKPKFLIRNFFHGLS